MGSLCRSLPSQLALGFSSCEGVESGVQDSERCCYSEELALGHLGLSGIEETVVVALVQLGLGNAGFLGLRFLWKSWF